MTDLSDTIDEPFKIEEGVPITRDCSPPKKRQDRPEFPFSKMKVGDSFAATPEQLGLPTLVHCQNMLTSAACGYRKKHHKGFGYTSRRQGGSVRIWRTA